MVTRLAHPLILICGFGKLQLLLHLKDSRVVLGFDLYLSSLESRAEHDKVYAVIGVEYEY